MKLLNFFFHGAFVIEASPILCLTLFVILTNQILNLSEDKNNRVTIILGICCSISYRVILDHVKQ